MVTWSSTIILSWISCDNFVMIGSLIVLSYDSELFIFHGTVTLDSLAEKNNMCQFRSAFVAVRWLRCSAGADSNKNNCGGHFAKMIRQPWFSATQLWVKLTCAFSPRPRLTLILGSDSNPYTANSLPLPITTIITSFRLIYPFKHLSLTSLAETVLTLAHTTSSSKLFSRWAWDTQIPGPAPLMSTGRLLL